MIIYTFRYLYSWSMNVIHYFATLLLLDDLPILQSALLYIMDVILLAK
jgi:hypothetical protein